MCYKWLVSCFVFVLISSACETQVVQFGKCADVETMKYFDLERFLGVWYEIARFPTWYEDYGFCAYKTVQYCGRTIEIEHVYIRDGIKYVLHVNSSYYPGDDAVFTIKENNIDPVGIPLTVLSTDYSNYALVYGCKHKHELGIKYMSAWILSRRPTLAEEIYQNVVSILNSVPNANAVYLEKVEQGEEKCNFHWTAHVQAVTAESTDDDYDDNDDYVE